MGFSLHDTVIRPGTETVMCYRHHLEAVYCIEGEGEVQLLPDGPVHRIRAGTVYALDRHERHVLRAKRRMRMVCVFNPPARARRCTAPTAPIRWRSARRERAGPHPRGRPEADRRRSLPLAGGR
jgi:uncharacterized cupin superfamily protein